MKKEEQSMLKISTLAQNSFKQKRINQFIFLIKYLRSNYSAKQIFFKFPCTCYIFYFLHGILHLYHDTILGIILYLQQMHQLVHRQVVQEYIAMLPSSQFYPIQTWWI